MVTESLEKLQAKYNSLSAKIEEQMRISAEIIDKLDVAYDDDYAMLSKMAHDALATLDKLLAKRREVMDTIDEVVELYKRIDIICNDRG